MKLNKQLKGESYILIGSLFWSLLPVVSLLTFNSIGALYTAGLSTILGGFFFAAILTYKKEWKQQVSKQCWINILAASIIIGVIFYGLVFLGISHTTAGNAALVQNMEAFFAIFVLSGLVKHEKITSIQILGAIFMIAGSTLIIFPGTFTPNKGDLIILLSTAIVPFGNMFSKKAIQEVSPSFLMFIRSVIAGTFLIILASFLEPAPTLQIIKQAWLLLAINGFLIFGVRTIFWLEGIRRINISKANSIGAISPAYTLILAYFILGDIPTIWQLAGLFPIVIGLWLLVYKKEPGLTVKN